MGKFVGLARILALIGAIVLIVEAVLSFFNIFHFGTGSFLGELFGGVLGGIVGLIIVIVIGVLVLIAGGFVKSNAKVGFNAIVVIILGILGFIFGSNVGGVLVIIAGILLLF